MHPFCSKTSRTKILKSLLKTIYLFIYILLFSFFFFLFKSFEVFSISLAVRRCRDPLEPLDTRRLDGRMKRIAEKARRDLKERQKTWQMVSFNKEKVNINSLLKECQWFLIDFLIDFKCSSSILSVLFRVFAGDGARLASLGAVIACGHGRARARARRVPRKLFGNIEQLNPRLFKELKGIEHVRSYLYNYIIVT